MTEGRINRLSQKIKEFAKNNISSYAGFTFERESEREFSHILIVNNDRFYSSTFSIPLENFGEALKVIQEFSGKDEKDIIENLGENGSYYTLDKPIFLHYLKLPTHMKQAIVL